MDIGIADILKTLNGQMELLILDILKIVFGAVAFSGILI
jgi:hypothetical protein